MSNIITEVNNNNNDHLQQIDVEDQELCFGHQDDDGNNTNNHENSISTVAIHEEDESRSNEKNSYQSSSTNNTNNTNEKDGDDSLSCDGAAAPAAGVTSQSFSTSAKTVVSSSYSHNNNNNNNSNNDHNNTQSLGGSTTTTTTTTTTTIAPSSDSIPHDRSHHKDSTEGRKICELWQKNKCPFGCICDFRHSGPGGSVSGAPDELVAEAFDRQRHCRNFLLNGRCPLHTKCRYEHRDARDLHELAIRQRIERDPKQYNQMYRGDNVTDPKGRRVCKDWRMYKCKFGAVCEYSHDGFPGAAVRGAPDRLCAEVFDGKCHCFDFLVRGKCNRRVGDCKFDHLSVSDMRRVAIRKRREKGIPVGDDERGFSTSDNNDDDDSDDDDNDSNKHNKNSDQLNSNHQHQQIKQNHHSATTTRDGDHPHAQPRKLTPQEADSHREKWVDDAAEREKRDRGATVCAMWMLGRCTYGTICGSLHPASEIERSGAGCIRNAPDKMLGRGYAIAKNRDGRRICKQFIVDQPCPKTHIDRKGVCDFEHISKESLVRIAVRDDEERGGGRKNYNNNNNNNKNSNSNDDRVSGRRRSRSRSNGANDSSRSQQQQQQQQFFAPPAGFYGNTSTVSTNVPPPPSHLQPLPVVAYAPPAPAMTPVPLPLHQQQTQFYYPPPQQYLPPPPQIIRIPGIESVRIPPPLKIDETTGYPLYRPAYKSPVTYPPPFLVMPPPPPAPVVIIASSFHQTFSGNGLAPANTATTTTVGQPPIQHNNHHNNVGVSKDAGFFNKL